MARIGGRSGRSHRSRGLRGHHHHRHHGYGHRRYYGSSGGINPGKVYEEAIDRIANTNSAPIFFNGTLALAGKDKKIMADLNQMDMNASMQTYMQAPTQEQYYMFPNIEDQMAQPQMAQQMGQPQMGQQMQMQTYPNMQNPINQQQGYQMMTQPLNPPMPNPLNEQSTMPQMSNPLNVQPMMGSPAPMMQPAMTVVPSGNVLTTLSISVVGQKTAQSSMGCYYITYILALLLIFPLCFMCCMWWKKIVYPKYEMIGTDFYYALGRYLQRFYTCNTLHLTVIDNGFNNEKARVLCEQLQNSQVRNFNFINLALECNYKGSEADDFQTNMMGIKGLDNVTSTINWGQKTF